MFLSGRDRESDLAVGQAGDHLAGRGRGERDRGGVLSTTNGNWALGSAGLDWLPLWSMIRTRAT